jgi:hypothetical protein
MKRGTGLNLPRPFSTTRQIALRDPQVTRQLGIVAAVDGKGRSQ